MHELRVLTVIRDGAVLDEAMAREFNVLDINHDGVINLEEAKHIMGELGFPVGGKLSEGDLAAVFSKFDLDSSGTVSTDEFTAFYKYLKARAVFITFDTDNTGALEKEEFVKVLLKLGHKSGDEDVDEMFSTYAVERVIPFSMTQTQAINLEQFLQLYFADPDDFPLAYLYEDPGVSADIALENGLDASLAKQFKKFDQRKSGGLDSADCQRMMKKMGFPVGDDFEEIFARFDVDGGGTIAPDEFTPLFKYVDARALFLKCDKDHNGALDKGELTKVLKKLGHKCKKADVDVIFDAYDKDRDGSIDLTEFMELFLTNPEDFPLAGDGAEEEAAALVAARRSVTVRPPRLELRLRLILD